MEHRRCPWCVGDSQYEQYHDKEWGVPVHDDQHLFEMLTLEGAQAGLSWITVLRKRENYRRLFASFDYEKIANFSDQQLDQILDDAGIIRNRLKVYSVRTNAKCLLQIRAEYGSFDNYIWQFVEHQTVRNQFSEISEVPANTEVSDKMSKALKKRGFKFVGTTICYAFMQAAGLVNDHLTCCFRHQALNRSN